MTVYLLDTDICVAYLRQRPALLVQRINMRPPADLRICSVVKAELLLGTYQSQRPQQNLAKVNAFAQQFLSLPFDDAAAAHYAPLRADLESKGTPIGPNDYQIAAIALANNVTLVTHNTQEFSRVVGLFLEAWLAP